MQLGKCLLFGLFMCLTTLFPVAQEVTIGTTLQTDMAAEGYTLFSPLSDKTTFLIDNCGREINKWTSEYFPGTRGLIDQDGQLVRAGAFPSEAFDLGGDGGVLERFDWNGELNWTFFYSDETKIQHHDIEILPSGNVLILAAELLSFEEAIALGRKEDALLHEELYVETIVELQPLPDNQAQIVWKWNSKDHLVQNISEELPNYVENTSEHPHRLDINYTPNEGAKDWLHFNGIDYREDLDQIVVTAKHTHEIYVIDHSTNTEEAAGSTGGNAGRGGDLLYRWGNPQAYGKGDSADQILYEPHDANWSQASYPDEGKIVIFSNGFERPEGNYSTVEVIDPPLNEEGQYALNEEGVFGPEEPFWHWEAEEPETFFSGTMSGAMQVSNGNYLICHALQGYCIEVDEAYNRHWEYVNPVTFFGPQAQGSEFPLPGNSFFNAEKYPSDYRGFQDYDLSPGAKIELDPVEGCDIVMTAAQTVSTPERIEVYPNPVNGQLCMSGLPEGNLQMILIDVNGNAHVRESLTQTCIELTDKVPPGIYFLQLTHSDGSPAGGTTFLKME